MAQQKVYTTTAWHRAEKRYVTYAVAAGSKAQARIVLNGGQPGGPVPKWGGAADGAERALESTGGWTVERRGEGWVPVRPDVDRDAFVAVDEALAAEGFGRRPPSVVNGGRRAAWGDENGRVVSMSPSGRGAGWWVTLHAPHAGVSYGIEVSANGSDAAGKVRDAAASLGVSVAAHDEWEAGYHAELEAESVAAETDAASAAKVARRVDAERAHFCMSTRTKNGEPCRQPPGCRFHRGRR